MNEAVLLTRARQGDGASYGQLVSLYQESAFRTAYLVLQDADAARDVIQNAFVKAYGGLGKLRPGAPLRPWLLRIVINEAHNQRLSDSRRRTREQRTAREAWTSGSYLSPEELVLRSERHRDLLDAIRQLSNTDQAVIILRYFQQFDETETAVTLGVPEGTVKSRLSRALHRLRLRMREETSWQTAEAAHEW